MNQEPISSSNTSKSGTDALHNQVETGTIKWFNSKRGYGVISRDRGGELYVHISDFKSGSLTQIKSGDKVQFTIIYGDIPKNSELKQAEQEVSRQSKKDNPISVANKVKVIERRLDQESIRNFQLINKTGDVKLTPIHLLNHVSPFLESLAELQEIINIISGKEKIDIIIRSITYNSPVSVSMDGVADAAKIARDIVDPFWREHSKRISELEEQSKIADIENAKADIIEKRARAQKERATAKQIETEASELLAKIELERKQLENEKMRLEIQSAKIDLALKVLNTFAVDLSETQKVAYVIQLLKPLGVLTETPLILSLDEK